MTTHPRRWLRTFGAICAALVCTLVLAAAFPARLQAQPFAAVVMDARTGQILYETDNSTARLHPASLTKMMTLYIAFEALENGEITLDTRVRISRHAASQPPSRLGLRAGQTIAFRYLIRAAALRSANDAATAIAEALEGSVSNFAERMNRTAAAIGMTRTRFRNPHGLTADGHLSTARDMSILGRQLYFDHPDYYNIFSRISEDAGIATVNNTNRLFLSSYRGADGIKTGYTSAAGYNLTAMAERDGVRILVTVMGARSSAHRLQRVTELMDRGFREAPRRVAVRRPARPDYVRAPEDRGSGPAAGRTIRLQTAPTTSRFPRPRPQPGDAPAPELIAALRDGIDEVIDEIREPDPAFDTDDPGVAAGVTSEEPEDFATAAADAAADSAADTPPESPDAQTLVALAAAAPERSPLPRARPPVTVVTLVQEDATPAETVAETVALAETADEVLDGSIDDGRGHDVEVARAAGFTVLDPEDYAAITQPLPPVPQPDPAALAEAVSAAGTADPEAVAAADPADTPLDPAAAVEALAASEGVLSIPGLPPITLTEPELAPEALIAATPLAAPEPPAAPLEPAATDLSVDSEGRILWRDEELLEALEHEDPEEPILAPTIVLTSATDTPAPAPAPMPEIVSRISTSGGRVWRVELGAFRSSFDAERVLLRIAISEAGTLGNGVRRVAQRSGSYVPEVHSLTEEEAQLACLRLVARDQSCTVVDP